VLYYFADFFLPKEKSPFLFGFFGGFLASPPGSDAMELESPVVLWNEISAWLYDLLETSGIPRLIVLLLMLRFKEGRLVVLDDYNLSLISMIKQDL